MSRDKAPDDDTTIDRMRREFGARLRRLRTEAGLTLQGLARRIGSNTSSLSALEKGQGSRAPDRHLVTGFVEECLAAARMDRVIKQELRTDLLGDQLALARAIEAGPDHSRARRTGPPRGQLIRDCDPRHLGVHRAIQVDGATADLPSYVERDVDSHRRGVRAILAEAGRQGGFVVLVGGSSVGKSRSAYEGIRALFPAWRLVHPDPDEAGWMRALTDHGPTETVVWLDELQRYLDGPQPLTADGVRRALRSSGPVIFVGTLWSERYAAYIAPPGPRSIEDPWRPIEDPWRRERELLGLADAVTVPASFSAEEQARAHSLAQDDPQLSVALRHNAYGLTQTLAAAPQLVERWKNANVYAAALLNAAIDAGRLGVQAPLSADFLRAAAPGYCTDLERATAPPDWFAAALDYATRTLLGAAAALEPAAAGMAAVRGYTVADYLRQHAGKARRRERVPAAAWRAVLYHMGNRDDLVRCGHAAMDRLLYHHAAPLYARSLAMGSPLGAHRLASLLARQGHPDTAVQILSAAAAGDGAAHVYLVRLLLEHGRLDELRQRADGGDDLAALHLTSALSDAGRHEESIDLLRGYLDAGRDVGRGLAELLDEQGSPQEAIDLLRDDADGGAHLASLLAKHGHEPELWARADAGDPFARQSVVQLLAERGALEELRNRAAQGDPNAALNAARLLADRGRIDEAVALLRQLEAWPAADEADKAAEAMRSVAVALASHALGPLSKRQLLDAVRAQQGRVDRIMAALKAMPKASFEYSLMEMVPDLLAATQAVATEMVEQSSAAEAVADLQAATESGDPYAPMTMSYLPLDREQIRGLLTPIRERAEAGNIVARARLIDLMLRYGELDAVQERAAAADTVAAFLLADFLVEDGQLEAGIAYLRERADAGHAACALKLDDLLTNHGRWEDLRDRADGGDTYAQLQLADPLVRPEACGDHAQKQVRAAMDELRDLVAQFEVANREPTESEQIDELRRAVDAGEAHAEHRLADVLAELGRVNDLRTMVDAGEPWAADRLVAAMRQQGRNEEADRLERFGLDDEGSIATAALLLPSDPGLYRQ